MKILAFGVHWSSFNSDHIYDFGSCDYSPLLSRNEKKFARLKLSKVYDFSDCPAHGYLKEQAEDNLRYNRENGTDEDSPKNLLLKYDGKYTWLKGKIKGDYVYGVKNKEESQRSEYDYYDYEVRYDAGPKDLAYFEAKDRNYLQRIRGKDDDSGELRKLEPAVWYLRKSEGAQDTDIGNWWHELLERCDYYKPNATNQKIDALLLKAAEDEKGYDKKLAAEKLRKEQEEKLEQERQEQERIRQETRLAQEKAEREEKLYQQFKTVHNNAASILLSEKNTLEDLTAQIQGLKQVEKDIQGDIAQQARFKDLLLQISETKKRIETKIADIKDSLIYTASYESAEQMSILLKNGGNPTVCNDEGMNLAQLAVQTNDYHMVKLLLDFFQDKNERLNYAQIKNNDQEGLIQSAIRKSDASMVRVILSSFTLDEQKNWIRSAGLLKFTNQVGGSNKDELVKILSGALAGKVVSLIDSNKEAQFPASNLQLPNKPIINIVDEKNEMIIEKALLAETNVVKLNNRLEEQILGSYVIEYSSLKYSTNNKLGEGGFGVVYKGEWQNVPVAIKELHLKNLSKETLDEFKREAEIMAKLRFPNIVNLYGVCLQPNKYSMVMELMPKGSLYNLLHNGQPLPWKIRYSISMDIATGLAYLHSKKILHRDLKSPNVLLDQNLRAKLADFGLAEVRHETMTTSTMANQTAGSLPWMAPELFQRKAQYTEAADIYSTGMIFWEITSRKKPLKMHLIKRF
jgi:tRNA A-37 threonylcarbamoyl transferase component Bud32